MKKRSMMTVEEAANSITLKLSAKGEYGWEIKLFFMEGEEEEVLAKLRALDAELRTMFR